MQNNRHFIIIPKYIFDGLGNKIQDHALVIKEGWIENIIHVNTINKHRLTKEYYPDASVLPGLIDAHTHVSLPGTSPAELLNYCKTVDENSMFELACQHAKQMLEHGITTVRDCGAAHHVDIKCRNAILNKTFPGPRMLVCGIPLTSVGGSASFLGGEVKDITHAKAFIDEQLAANVDFIKIHSTGGVSTLHTDPSQAQFTQEEHREMAAYTHQKNKKIAAHAHGATGILYCARAKVDSIEHCSFLNKNKEMAFDPDIVKIILESETKVVPTLSIVHASLLSGRMGDNGQAIYENRLEISRQLLKSGISLIAGTDCGGPNTSHTSIFTEIELLMKIGMTAQEAISSATSKAANLLGVDHICGHIRPGITADLLVCEGDPEVNISQLRKIVQVYQAGIKILR